MYIVKETITVEDTNVNNKQIKCKPLRIMLHLDINTFIDNAEDLDIVIPMYNFIADSNNYCITSGSF